MTGGVDWEEKFYLQKYCIYKKNGTIYQFTQHFFVESRFHRHFWIFHVGNFFQLTPFFCNFFINRGGGIKKIPPSDGIFWKKNTPFSGKNPDCFVPRNDEIPSFTPVWFFNWTLAMTGMHFASETNLRHLQLLVLPGCLKKYEYPDCYSGKNEHP